LASPDPIVFLNKLLNIEVQKMEGNIVSLATLRASCRELEDEIYHLEEIGQVPNTIKTFSAENRVEK
jgi:hypothetical protein